MATGTDYQTPYIDVSLSLPSNRVICAPRVSTLFGVVTASPKLFRWLFVLIVTAAWIAPATAQMRCGVPMPSKQEIERSTARFDTRRFFDTVTPAFGGRFKGYAVIFTDANGRRLGFRRAGWAVDPCDAGDPVPFTLNTETAIGSVTKLLTTVAVLKVSTDHMRLNRSMTNFLPFRWRNTAHDYYDTVSIADLLQHKAGFRFSGGGEHVASRLSKGRELPTPRGTRDYSNSSMGVFHFIYARYAFRAPYHQTEVDFQNAPDDAYNNAIQDKTSHYFNVGLYNKIFRPLRISATCDARKPKLPPNRPQYFHFHDVAKSYSGRLDNRGIVLASSERNCAAGGVYMSAKDLARFMTALGDRDFLPVAHQNRMMNAGPATDLFGFGVDTGSAMKNAKDGRVFDHNGKRNENNHVSVAWVMRFQSGANVVFVANSDWSGVNVAGTLIAAYNAALN
jgi:CubicO group peptidase (beta-lactamase class C family)